jgi:hypothetical protein
MTINTGQIVQKPETTLTGHFFLPPNVVDLRYKTEEEIRADEQTDDPEATTEVPGAEEPVVIEVPTGEFTDPLGTPPATPEIPAPDWMTVISQSVKIGNDGTTLVDVIIEVQDIPGVTTVDVAVTKV